MAVENPVESVGNPDRLNEISVKNFIHIYAKGNHNE